MRFTDIKRLADMSFSVKNNVIALSFLIPYTLLLGARYQEVMKKFYTYAKLFENTE